MTTEPDTRPRYKRNPESGIYAETASHLFVIVAGPFRGADGKEHVLMDYAPESPEPDGGFPAPWRVHPSLLEKYYVEVRPPAVEAALTNGDCERWVLVFDDGSMSIHEGRERALYSASHALGVSVKHAYPETQVWIAPLIVDVDRCERLTPDTIPSE